ncbi:MAG: HAD family hydrolase [Anaerolineae bacterium]
MLTACGHRLDPALIILDKDGTLIAFDHLWHRWFALLLEHLGDDLDARGPHGVQMAATLGYDVETGAWDPRGPLTIASTSELTVLLAGLLYANQGMSWEDAISRVRTAERKARAALPLEDLVKPVGDVAARLSDWRAKGMRLAIATTDERDLTMRSLACVGLEALFDAIVCGDDGIPLKPAPDMVLQICERLSIPPRETVVIGDTAADLVMAREAGAMAAIGVLSGAGTREDLARYTDLIVPDIHHVRVVASPKDRHR